MTGEDWLQEEVRANKKESRGNEKESKVIGALPAGIIYSTVIRFFPLIKRTIQHNYNISQLNKASSFVLAIKLSIGVFPRLY